MAECEDANKNPVCPYITTIKQSSQDIQQIKTALIGEDLQSGMVSKIKDIETKVDGAIKRKWGSKDYAGAIMALAAFITALAALTQVIAI